MGLATVRAAGMKINWLVASATVPAHVGTQRNNADTVVKVNLCVSSLCPPLRISTFVTVRSVTMSLVSSAVISLAEIATVRVRTNSHVKMTSLVQTLSVSALDVWLRI